MKITGPGAGLPPEAAAPTAETEVKETPGGGAAFADKLQKTGGAGAAGPQAEVSGPALVSDVGTDLKAGKITTEMAMDRVISRIIERQLGADAPPAVRAQVEAALREALASDPLLVEKVKSLGT
jgi:hypothetical protein